MSFEMSSRGLLLLLRFQIPVYWSQSQLSVGERRPTPSSAIPQRLLGDRWAVVLARVLRWKRLFLTTALEVILKLLTWFLTRRCEERMGAGMEPRGTPAGEEANGGRKISQTDREAKSDRRIL